jgi:hypothetical protein
MSDYVLYSGLSVPLILDKCTQFQFITSTGRDMFTGELVYPNMTPAQILDKCVQITLVNSSGVSN